MRPLLTIALAAGLLTAAPAALLQPQPLTVALVARDGTRTALGTLPANTFALRIAPDGLRVTFDTADGTIWIADISSITEARRFGAGRFPTWSADGSRVMFIDDPQGASRLMSQPVTGGAAQVLVTAARAPEAWRPDGALFTYITRKEGDDYDIWAYDSVAAAPRALVARPGSAEMSSRFSPDGRWIAYEANDTGEYEVYVEPYPVTGVRTRVSTAGGHRPLWSADGRELYFDDDGALYVARVEVEPRFGVGAAERLPIAGFVQNFGRRTYDITPDGRQFLMLFPPAR